MKEDEHKVRREMLIGLIKECDIDDIEKLEEALTIPNKMKTAVSVLHVLQCRNHKPTGTCFFYTDEDYKDCWEREDHKKWLGIAHDLMGMEDLSDPQDLLEKIGQAQRIIKVVEDKHSTIVKTIIREAL